MRIHLYGNILNNAYTLACFLRKRGIEAVVFVDHSSESQNLPFWENPLLKKESLPSWIRMVNLMSWRGPLGGMQRFFREFNQCDLIHTFGYGPIWARRPFVFQSYGSDLSDYPHDSFRNINLQQGLRGLWKNDGSGNFGLMGSVLGPLQKRGLRRATHIIYSMPRQVHPDGELNRLKLDQPRTFLPLMQDFTRYKKCPVPDEFKQLVKGYDLIFFHPSRHVYNRGGLFDEKGNDKALRAYARFEKETSVKTLLLTIEKGWDVDKSKRLVQELGIKNIHWFQQMNKERMREIYSLEKLVVLDQFQTHPITRDLGFFGSIGLEAMGMGALLVTNFQKKKLTPFLDGYFDSFPPVFSALSENEILEQIRLIAKLSPENWQKHSITCRDWVVRYFHWDNVIDHYISIYHSVLKQRKPFAEAPPLSAVPAAI